MTDEIKKGDVVFFKSDSSFRMTVGHVLDGGKVAECYRAVNSGENQDVKQFNLPVCLLEVENPSSSSED